MSETYKTAEEWGLPKRSSYYGVECWICGHLIYPSMGKAKCHGIQEAKKYDHKCERFQEICSVCLQVQIFNKEYLHKENSPNCVGGVKRLFLCGRDMQRIAVWKVLDHKPWLRQIQKLPPEEIKA